MVAGANGIIAQSTDSGASWTVLALPATTGLAAGATFVAYDATTPTTIYATERTGGGVVRLSFLDLAAGWIVIDGQGLAGQFPVALATGMISADNGALYVADITAGTGMYRVLDPLSTVSAVAAMPYWEMANDTGAATTNLAGLATPSTFNGLWMVDSTLWSIDAANVRVYHYTEALAKQIEGVAVTAGVTTGLATWDAPTTGILMTYQSVIDDDARCTANAAGVVSTIDATDRDDTVTVLITGTNYWYKVRVATPVRSLYSDVVAFTTLLGATAQTTALSAPAPGADNVLLAPNFQWAPVAGATGYDVEVSTASDFSTLVASASVTNPVWSCTATLSYSTVYYWRVRATTAATTGGWVAGIFTTMAEPAPTPEPTPPVIVEENPPPEITVTVPPAEPAPTPGYIWAIIGIGAVLVVVVLVLVWSTRRTRV
jgi:hypothetical protein